MELKEEIEALKLDAQIQSTRVRLINQQIERLQDKRATWLNRYLVFIRNSSAEQRQEWLQETKEKTAELERKLSHQAFRIDEARKNQNVIQHKLDSIESESAAAKQWVHRQTHSMVRLLKYYEDNTEDIKQTRQLHQKLLHELTDGVAPTLGERVDLLWLRMRKVWNYRLGDIEDRPITVGKIAIGCVLFLVGLWFSRRTTRAVGKRVLPKLGMDPSEAATVQTIVCYSMICAFGLLALKVVNVPLTAFTRLGGALALGFGFGSQNIINNFISGLILLAERPIKIGDLVEINDLYGNVEHIGARSTRIKTGANLEIIVPNSSFLETNVVNWTLTDDRVRTVVKVGVAYGSPTDQVKQLLLESLEDTVGVLNVPRPTILFSEFGPDSLNFEAHFWLHMRSLMQRWQTESEVRYKVDEKFRKAGVVIAFPQRDVHLAGSRPLQIEIIEDEKWQAA